MEEVEKNRVIALEEDLCQFLTMKIYNKMKKHGIIQKSTKEIKVIDDFSSLN